MKNTLRLKFAALLFAAAFPLISTAAVPPVEQLLPSDTLLVISAADANQLKTAWNDSPAGKLLADPAMKPMRDKFVAKWNENVLGPLERDLGVKLGEYTSLLRGQVTLAITQNGWKGEKDDSEPAALLLVDSRDKADQLKTNLSELRKKWADSGKTIKTETIRGVEFWAIAVSSNNVPGALRNILPKHEPIQELGRENEQPGAGGDELLIGQHESLLIVGSSASGIEKVMARLTGGTVSPLADEASFDGDRNRVFRGAPVIAWFNAKRFVDVLASLPPDEPNPEAPSPLPQFSPAKIINALGLGGLRTLAAAWRSSAEGSTLDVYIGAPESSRTGIMKLLDSEKKDSSPPAFVPADVVKFQRWRLDNQKALATIEKMLAEISPQAANVVNFLISTGNEVGRQDGDDSFDIRKNIFGNLGDDIITYSKPPRGTSAAELASPPSLVLIGSPNAEKVAASLKALLAIISPRAAPQEREFIGKKIYTVNMSGGVVGMPALAGKSIQYSASGGYVAIGTDAATLEEFLRSAETPPKPLREKSGLGDAAEKIGGQATGLFNYENEAESMRIAFETLKADAGTTGKKEDNLELLAGSVPFVGPQKNIKAWVDYSLLPEFEKVSKYFHFTVHTGVSTSDGITYKFFSPTPPELRN
ncbi:MAG TPA: hypothetical protein PKA41_01910 [Verrucomicrobiota bacterium]|nr:hypothetical protein [Verrucomicrobiota bacterium]